MDRILDSKVVIKSIIGSIPTFTFQILMLCYLFENLHNHVILYAILFYYNIFVDQVLGHKMRFMKSKSIGNNYFIFFNELYTDLH